MPFETHISSLNTLAYRASIRTFRQFNVPSFLAIYDATKFVICPRLQSFARFRISKAFYFYFKTKLNPTISFSLPYHPTINPNSFLTFLHAILRNTGIPHSVAKYLSNLITFLNQTTSEYFRFVCKLPKYSLCMGHQQQTKMLVRHIP